MGHATIWVQTHTIYYRPVPVNDPSNYAKPSVSSGKDAVSNTVSGGGAQCVLILCSASSSSSGAITRRVKGASGKSSNKNIRDYLTGIFVISTE